MENFDWLSDFYGKYNENKRLQTPYGRVEFLTTMKEILSDFPDPKGVRLLDIGCGPGQYSMALAEKGFEVLAIDPVPYHVGILKQKIEREKTKGITVKSGNVLQLSKLPENSFDGILMLGPMYHLFTEEDKVDALKSVKRLLRENGRIYVAYIMNEFAVIEHCFMKNTVKQDIAEKKLDENFRIHADKEDLFSYDRLDDIDRYREKAGLSRVRILSQDGPVNYKRDMFKTMDEENFRLFLEFHFRTCYDKSLLGAGNHTLDVLTKNPL